MNTELAIAHLKEQITNKTYHISGRLGTYKTLKKELSIAEKPLTTALRYLQNEGLIVVTTRGIFVYPKPDGKLCPICLLWKSTKEFRISSGKRAHDGLQAYCTPCARLNSQLRYHNMTIEEYHKLLNKQNGLCAVCSESMEVPEIDHDHACCNTGRTCGRCTRALLCKDCNRTLGWSRDNPARLRACAEYIEAHKGGDE